MYSYTYVIIGIRVYCLKTIQINRLSESNIALELFSVHINTSLFFFYFYHNDTSSLL